MKRTVRTLAAISASAVALLSGAALAAPASAQSGNPYSPQANGHGYRHGAFNTKENHASMTAWAKANPASAAAAAATGTRTLSYQGGIQGVGVTSSRPKVYLIFWGTQWGTQSTNAAGDLTFSSDTYGGAPKLQAMFRGLGAGELWSGTFTQYCDGAVTTGAVTCPAGAPHILMPSGAAKGGALEGVWYDNSAAEPTTATGTQIAQEAIKAAAHFGNTTPASQRYVQYVILSAKGLNPDSYKTGGFCAWHDYTGDSTLPGGAVTSPYGDLAFTNMPYVMDQGTSCGMNYVNAGTAGQTDGYTMVEGHEYGETITDQFPAGGWINATGSSYDGQENADECSWTGTNAATGGSNNIAFSTGTFAEQGSWSNDTNACALTHADVSGGGSTGNTVTVTNPGAQTGTVGTAKSLQIVASDSSTTATLSYAATGLPTGLTINASTGLISGTPTTAGTFSTVVTVTDNTGVSGTASFTWSISSTGTCTGTLLTNGGWESGSTGWTLNRAAIAATATTAEPAHSGTKIGWFDGLGSTRTDTAAQSLTIPAGCSATKLTYYLHIDTKETTTATAYDKFTVKVGTTTLQTLSNLNKNTGYALQTVNLGAYAGQTVTLTFTGSEDISLATNFVMDDAVVTLG